MRAARGQQGFVLAVVLFFVVLLFASISTFVRRATLDAVIVSNQDQLAQAEALARGGIQLGIALLLQDLLDEATQGLPIDSDQDLWAQVDQFTLPVEDGGQLRVEIRDSGSRLNLNALFAEGLPRDDATEVLLQELFAKVVDEMPGRAEEKFYDPKELARNLIDWVDADDVRLRGGAENEYYRDQFPPYEAANRPLLSLEELALVEGFDAALVRALGQYATVYPWAGESGVNPNTAPTWVLATLYHGTGGDYRLAGKKDVSRILRQRGEGQVLCPEELSHESCLPMQEALEGTVFPPPTFSTDVFEIRSEGRYGGSRRSIEAVVDRSSEPAPAILAWRVR